MFFEEKKTGDKSRMRKKPRVSYRSSKQMNFADLYSFLMCKQKEEAKQLPLFNFKYLKN
jgi:hypothetical protein